MNSSAGINSTLREAELRRRNGDLGAAAQLYEAVLRRQPGNLRALDALGQIQFASGHFAEAERIYAEVLRRAPNRVTPVYNRGCALLLLKRTEEAIRCFDQALVSAPDHLGALVNRSAALQELERSEDALADCDRALSLNPIFAPALVNRGNALLALRRLDEALAAYRQALAVESNVPGAEDGCAIVQYERGEVSRTPVAFLQRLYAKFSTYYDDQMVRGLGYCGHTELRRLANDLRPALQAPLAILDLGCGTGLAGLAFRDLATGGSIDGVDISPEMLSIAATRGVYTSLRLADIDPTLASVTDVYDLIMAADTFIYFGDLQPVFGGVRRSLKPGGWFLFTVESTEDSDWQFGRGRRYQHGRAYLQRVGESVGLRMNACTAFTLRTELGVPVSAFAVALRLNSTGI